MEKTFINAYDRRANLSASNINILSVTLEGSYYVVCYEFQWRDPRSGAARWAKTFTDIPRDYIDESQHTLYKEVSDHILDEVVKARDRLENGKK